MWPIYAIEIFDYLTKNIKFILSHPQFALTIYFKLKEFEHNNDLHNEEINYYLYKIFNITTNI